MKAEKVTYWAGPDGNIRKMVKYEGKWFYARKNGIIESSMYIWEPNRGIHLNYWLAYRDACKIRQQIQQNATA